MREAYLCCEGAACNAGLSAEQREREFIPRGATETMRAELLKDARGVVSRQLAVTPHVRVSGVDRYGRLRYACVRCQHERVYGCVAETWGAGPYG